MTLAGLAARVSALISNIVVGYFLSPREIGTYAVAVGILGFTGIFRAGGTAHYLPTITPEDYDRKSGRMFWWGAAFLGLGAVFTWAAAAAVPELAARGTAMPPRLAEALWLLGLRQVFMAFSQIGRMRLAVNLQFPLLARLDVWNALVRLVLTIVLACGGMGALALVIPYTIAPLVEIVFFAVHGELGRMRYRWDGMSVRDMAHLMAWPLLVAVLVSLNTQVNFLLVKLVVPLATVGVFYFAYQLAGQPVQMLSSALTNVFAAHFTRDRGNPAREARSVRQAFEGSMLFVPLVMFALAAAFPTTRRLLWPGKWEEAVVPVIVLCAAGSWAATITLLTGPLAGLRQFRPIAAFEALKTVGVLGGAALGTAAVLVIERWFPTAPAWLQDDATLISASTALSVAVISIWQLLWLLPGYGMDRWQVVRTLLHGPALAAALAVAAHAIGVSLADSILLPDGGRAEAAVEFAITTVVYGVGALLAVRFMAETTVTGVVEMMPPRLRELAMRALWLEH